MVNEAIEVAYNPGPCMSFVARMTDGSWILPFEIVDIGTADVFYKISDSPFTFGDELLFALVANGLIPKSSPYVKDGGWFADGKKTAVVGVEESGLWKQGLLARDVFGFAT